MFHIDKYEENISDYIKKLSDLYYNTPNIIGIGLGRKEYNGYRTSIPSLTFLVKEKISPSELNPKYLLPKTIGSIITDVIETGSFSPNPCKNNNINTSTKDLIATFSRPAYGGLSCSNIYSSPECQGSIAYAVTDIPEKSYIFILSCNHVLTKDFTNTPGDAVHQPARLYKNNGYLCKSHFAIPLIQKSNNKTDNPVAEYNEVDAALAKVANNTKETRERLLSAGIGLGKDKGKIFLDEKKTPKNDYNVWKMSPYPPYNKNYGTIKTVQTTLFSFDIGDGYYKKTFAFKNQVIANMPYSPGDAGALIIKEEKVLNLFTKNFAVGMCIGGSSTTSQEPYAVFTPIDIVLSKLNVDFLT